MNADSITVPPSKNVYFVRFGQDNPSVKPSLPDADLSRLLGAADVAASGEHMQPLLIERTES